MAKQSTSGLTLRHKVGYGMGDAGASLTNVMIGMFATRFYVNVLKIDTVAMATILLIWNIWDAVNDPLMGALMDKSFSKNKNPKGKFRPWLLRATPLLAITSLVFFIAPTYFEGAAMMVVLFFAKILYEGSYTMFNIPMGSLLSAMSKTDEERAQLSSARGFGSTIGACIPMIGTPIILSVLGENNAIAYIVAISIMAVIGFAVCLLHYAWTEERAESVSETQNADNIKFTDIFVVFKENRAFLALCIHSIFICIENGILSTLGSYMYADVLGNIGLMSASTGISMVLGFVVLGVAPKLSKKYGLTRIICMSLLASVVLFVGLFVMHLVMDVNAFVHLIISSLAATLATASTQMQWGMVGEAIDYNEYLTGKRTEGSIYGTFSLSRRIGTTISNSLAVLLLGWIGYDANLAVQTAGTITGIKALCVLLPGLCALGSWFAFRFIWNITPEVKEKMHAFFEAKKVAE